MRRISRISKSIDCSQLSQRLPVRPTSSICLACQSKALTIQKPAPTFSTSALRQADEKKARAFSEKIRSKIWGTEYAPGREDPYSKDSPMRTAIEERQATAQELTRTEIPDDVPYTPASDWDGLEWVGTDEWIATQNQENNLIAFKSFLPSHKLSTPEQLQWAVYRAVVEVFALKTANKSLQVSQKAQPSALLPTSGIEIIRSTDGGNITIEFSSEEAKQEFIKPLIGDGESETLRTVGSLETVNVVDELIAADAATIEKTPWKTIPLYEPEIKLAVIKRIMQLSGIRVPDMVIRDGVTPQEIYWALKKIVKPKRLSNLIEISDNWQQEDLPNVKISPRRITPVDKEKDIGRWKVIEQELLKRGLPVVGDS